MLPLLSQPVLLPKPLAKLELGAALAPPKSWQWFSPPYDRLLQGDAFEIGNDCLGELAEAGLSCGHELVERCFGAGESLSKAAFVVVAVSSALLR